MRTALLLAAALVLCSAASPQEAIMHNGYPAIEYRDSHREEAVVERKTSPDTLRFSVIDAGHGWSGCKGHVELSAESFRWSPDCSMEAFQVPLSTIVTVERPSMSHHAHVRFATRRIVYGFVGVRDKEVYSGDLAEFFALAVHDFAAADAKFDRLTASLQPPKPQPVVIQQPVAPPKPPEATLSLTTDPADVQVYLDDVFRGTSSGEGKLVIPGIAPGAHKLRLSMIGFKEVSQTLELASGEKAFTSKMEKSGPKPLAQADIEQALVNGVPKTRLISLVNEYGVDFAINDASEQSLRAKGADDSVLFAIAKNKR